MSDALDSFSIDAARLFEEHLTRFVAWCEKHWRFERGQGEPDLTEDQAEGWNRCIEGLSGAVACYMEEFP
jgi:hypothetical protein